MIESASDDVCRQVGFPLCGGALVCSDELSVEHSETGVATPDASVSLSESVSASMWSYS